MNYPRIQIYRIYLRMKWFWFERAKRTKKVAGKAQASSNKAPTTINQ